MGRELGEDTNYGCGQSFRNTSSGSWDAVKAYVRIRNEGNKAVGSLTLSIRNNSAITSSPGVITYAEKTLLTANFDSAYDWIEFDLGSGAPLGTSTTYWIVLIPSFQEDEDDFYMVDGNESEGYNPTGWSAGQFKIYNGSWSTWGDKSDGSYIPMDMNFILLGEEETTDQIADMVTDSNFLLDTDIVDASGINQNQWRNGDKTAKTEIEELLELGTSNDLRMLCRVAPNLHLEVWEEPVLNEEDFSISHDEIIFDQYGAIVPNSTCPVGMYLRYEDIIPENVNADQLLDIGYVFVEKAEYDCTNDTYKIVQTRDIDPIERIIGDPTRKEKRSEWMQKMRTYIVDIIKDVEGEKRGSAWVGGGGFTSSYVRTDGTSVLSGDWVADDTGNYSITAHFLIAEEKVIIRDSWGAPTLMFQTTSGGNTDRISLSGTQSNFTVYDETTDEYMMILQDDDILFYLGSNLVFEIAPTYATFASELRFYSTSNYAGLNGPVDNPVSSVSFYLPDADGDANDVLVTDGSGSWSFEDELVLGNLTIGRGVDGTDYTLTFDGYNNDGVITWMEDEDYFQFSDDILMSSTEKIQFRDTAIYAYSSQDGYLDIVADSRLVLNSPYIFIGAAAADVNYALVFDGESNDGYLYWMEDEDYFRFEDDIFLNDGENLVLGTTTGSMVGSTASQKLAFWGATPIVQQAHIADSAGLWTVDGQDTVNAILAALENVGILASS
jgi:hypothetical protein